MNASERGNLMIRLAGLIKDNLSTLAVKNCVHCIKFDSMEFLPGIEHY